MSTPLWVAVDDEEFEVSGVGVQISLKTSTPSMIFDLGKIWTQVRGRWENGGPRDFPRLTKVSPLEVSMYYI